MIEDPETPAENPPEPVDQDEAARIRDMQRRLRGETEAYHKGLGKRQVKGGSRR